MRIAVIGSNGQVGSEFVRVAREAGINTIELRHEACEVTDAASIASALEPLRPGDVVFNTAAFHRTDDCEDMADRALSVNALGAYRVAAAARERGAIAVYVSTDFVFDGAKRTPYVESDVPGPINVYGASKAAGEVLVKAANPAHYVARIAAVFGPAGSSGKGGNFVETMVAKARAGLSPDVVDDIVTSPTSAADAAALLLALVRDQAPYGIYHLTNAGQCSWFEFTQSIFELVGAPGQPKAVSATTQSGKARRPAYSALASERLEKLGLHARPWREALGDYLTRKGHRPT
jgi:dTDP-4-dehydrorhamnose reductase